MATVKYTAEALSQAAKLPKTIKLRIMKLTDRLEKWPDVSGAKPLTGNLAGHYRLRTGDYRVQFHVKEDLVVIERVGHRDGFYDE